LHPGATKGDIAAMKTRHLFAIAALGLLCWSMTSCTTTVTKLPDGTTITTTGPDAVGVNAALVAAQIFAEK
jgi:phosphoribosylcarboxyaminoimidazole (NCAIR) mutase